MKPKDERRGDSEVRPGTAKAPEEVGVLVVACMDLFTIRGDNVDGDQVVDGEAVHSLHACHPPAQRETGHTRVADDPDRTGQPERLRCLVELLEQRSTLNPCGTSLRIHP